MLLAHQAMSPPVQEWALQLLPSNQCCWDWVRGLSYQDWVYPFIKRPCNTLTGRYGQMGLCSGFWCRYPDVLVTECVNGRGGHCSLPRKATLCHQIPDLGFQWQSAESKGWRKDRRMSMLTELCHGPDDHKQWGMFPGSPVSLPAPYLSPETDQEKERILRGRAAKDWSRVSL